MASSNSFFTPGPTVVLPPSQPDQHLPNSHQSMSPATDLTPNDAIRPTLSAIAGRKRSRGDIHSPEDDIAPDGSISQIATDTPMSPRGEPVFGPGMTLIYPDDPGYEARPESQSGTWVDERDERNQWHLLNEMRPPMTTRKSQRMDSGAVSGADDLAQLVLPPHMREVTVEPLIDEATRALGISWVRMDSGEALQINQAAYAKWIQNHYPSLEDVSVWFENSAIPGYLVAARNTYNNRSEYYIFSNDLTEARLVTNDPTQLVPRLQMPALHLIAPGGCIKAEVEPVAPAPPEVSNVQYARMSEDFSMHPAMLRGYFPSWESMEMD